MIRLAKENAWGYTRILGELKKLGIENALRTTVRNILDEAGIDNRYGTEAWPRNVERFPNPPREDLVVV